MDQYQTAIGRDVGQVDTDSGGLARYSLKLQAPPGIRNGSEPELSLEYCQGAPNGSLGVGWALGGLSCIRRGPASLAYDVLNPRPADYDRSTPKLHLDGVELLCLSGNYEASNAEYTTENESIRRTVYRQGPGFLVVESTGRRAEYGSSEDSRVFVAGTQNVREWRLKTTSDYHGNTITYNYVSSPQGNGAFADTNACYLGSVRYTSNFKTGHMGARIVKLEYGPRNDAVVQTVQGDKCVWASLLTAVRFGTVVGDEEFTLSRSYELAYASSPHTGDSHITSITETSLDGEKTTKLLPSTFTYTSPGVSPDKMFSSLGQKTTILPSATNAVALFTINVSGRSLADMACIRYNNSTEQMTLKTYLAEKDSAGRVTWIQSTGPGAEAALPLMNPQNGFPNILTTDMNGDGRADLVVPYADRNNKVCFSISQCVGTGFQKSRPKETTFMWTEGSRFMALDLSGQGSVDIVQIYPSGQKLAFRNFPGVTKDGVVGLKDAVTSLTNHDFKGTLDWCQLSNAGTGAKSLVRIWAQETDNNSTQLKATCFTLLKAGDSSAGFRESMTSNLGGPGPSSKIKYHVLASDINADGTQDIVLATAEFKSGRMALTFRTYLGDGHGGFQKHGDPVLRELNAPTPLDSAEPGSFHTTNLNGSNYPSLCYVYQLKGGKSFACVSVDGRSDGLVSSATLANLVQDLPYDTMQVMATDTNGNGMGDWICYNLDGGVPRVLPIHNTAGVTGFLESSTSPMGLKTRLIYGCLTDPGVYTPAVDWKTYSNQSTDGYPVIAAPNYVVTQLDHCNDKDINSFDYSTTIRKTYANARINTLGRGWQGFQKIRTLNVADSILTTEHYHQVWPLTGSKTQIDTSAPGGATVKSVITDYQSSSRQSGSWKIFSSRKTRERTIHYDDGMETRCNAIEYAYDNLGNMTLQHTWETQLAQTMHESWRRCAYISIDGVTDVMAAEKVSNKGENLDMTRFETGDCSLTLYENDATRAILKSVAEWSTDINDFSKRYITFNEYGKEVRTLEASGLVRETIYDDVYKTFPVKIVETGPGVASVELAAFDAASGLEVARLTPGGLLTCYRLDGFGRTIEKRAKAAGPHLQAVQGSAFLAQRAIVAERTLLALLEESYLEPQQQIKYEQQKSQSGAAFLALKITRLSHSGSSGESTVTDYVDCVKQIRKRSSQDGKDTDQTWLYWEFTSLGSHAFESFPKKVSGEIGLDWTPDPSQGTRSTFDLLGRPVREVRPGHGIQEHMIVKTIAYTIGGAQVRERITTGKTRSNDESELSALQRRYVHIGNEELVVENIDESGIRSSLQYDVMGRLVGCSDAAGQSEVRSYSSQGKLTLVNNVYQNASGDGTTPALSYEYDPAGHLVRQTNAANESVAYTRDPKGRPLLKIGSDGRTLKYAYNEALAQLKSITSFANGESGQVESIFEFTYDHRGRVSRRRMVLADGSTYDTSLNYNWQDEIVQKVLPDGATLDYHYQGSEISDTTLSSGTSSKWTLKAHVDKYSSFGRPELISISGTGLAGSAIHEWGYDSQGFPVSHSLTSESKTLIREDYVYNDLDQMVRKHEFLTGATTDFVYQGKRLASSQSGPGNPNLYAYDPAGNLTEKQGIQINRHTQGITGLRDGSPVFDIAYDAAGRMIRRQTASATYDFQYDTFGALKSMTDPTKHQSIELLVDPDGEMYSRRHADGTMDLFLDEDFSIHTGSDGTQTARHHLMDYSNAHGVGHLLGTVSNVFETAESKRPLSGTRSVSVQFSDTKGNVTHSFKEDWTLQERLEYDDFGLLQRSGTEKSEQQTPCTFEGKYFDEKSGLINFGARWYDPLAGRFATPDDILDIASLIRTDGLNRYTFENNDPINNTDPTGHWSWSAIGGIILSSALIVGAVALTVVTGGAAAPLAAAAVGALAGGGVAGFLYSASHKDEPDPGKFWGGFATTVAANALIGAATGGLGAYASSSSVIASATGRIAAKAVLGGATSVVGKAAERAVENIFFGKHYDLWEGAGKTFLTGAAVGVAAGAYAERTASKAASAASKIKAPFTLSTKEVLSFKPTNTFADVSKEAWKMGAKKLAGKAAGLALKDQIIDKKALWQDFKSWAR